MISHTVERADIEMALIRILSVHGLVLSSENMSTADRRERIRVTIMERRCQHGMFNEELTYGQAYKRCYGQSVELRKSPRPEAAGPEVPEPAEEGDSDSETDE
jgi:hypothetical protein